MKKLVYLFVLVVLPVGSLFSQNKQEEQLDSVLTQYTGQKYTAYVDFLKQQYHEMEQPIVKPKTNENGLVLVSRSVSISSEKFPLVVISKGNKSWNLFEMLQEKISFKTIEKVSFFKPKTPEALLYGERGRFGVCIIHIK